MEVACIRVLGQSSYYRAIEYNITLGQRLRGA